MQKADPSLGLQKQPLTGAGYHDNQSVANLRHTPCLTWVFSAEKISAYKSSIRIYFMSPVCCWTPDVSSCPVSTSHSYVLNVGPGSASKLFVMSQSMLPGPASSNRMSTDWGTLRFDNSVLFYILLIVNMFIYAKCSTCLYLIKSLSQYQNFNTTLNGTWWHVSI